MISSIIFEPVSPLTKCGNIEFGVAPYPYELRVGKSFIDTAHRWWKVCSISVEIGSGWTKTTVKLNLLT